ncbi:MAG: helix-turn-helix domain-containing protein [Cyanobacteria bacterium P01_A01_bin.84]
MNQKQNLPENDVKHLTFSQEEIKILNHQHYCFIYFEEAPCNLYINFKKEKISPNILIFLNPGEVLFSNAKWCSKVHVIAFRGSYFSASLEVLASRFNTKFFSNYFDVAKVALDKNKVTIVKDIFKYLREDQGLSEHRFSRFKGAVDTLVIESLHTKAAAVYKYLIEFNHLLNIEHAVNHKVSDYAKKLDLKPKQFLIYLNEIGTQSPKEIILKRLLLESQKLLLSTNLNSAEITFKIGFNDPAYFSRFFKKNTGISPLNYRKKYKNILQEIDN